MFLLHNRFCSGQMRIQGKGDRLQLPFQVNSGHCVKTCQGVRSVQVVGQAGCRKGPRVLQAATCALQLCFVCFALLDLLSLRRDRREERRTARGGACWTEREGSRGPSLSFIVQFVLPLLFSHSLKNIPVHWASALGAVGLGGWPGIE